MQINLEKEGVGEREKEGRGKGEGNETERNIHKNSLDFVLHGGVREITGIHRHSNHNYYKE